jgi:DMSO reductase anchor subunit
MPFREKTAWISIVSMSGIYGFYFGSALRSGSWATGLHFFRFLAVIIALIIAQIALTIAVAIWTPTEAKQPRDEREALIELKSTRAAYALLLSCVVCTCLFAPPFLFNANALLFILVMAELVRYASQIMQYRCGA